MPTQITRDSGYRTLAVQQSAYISSAHIDIGAYAFGTIISPSAVDSSASIGFKVCHSPNGTFVPLRDESGNIVEIDPTTDQAYSFPAELGGVTFLKLWLQTGGTNVPAEADRTFVLVLKG